MDQDAGKGNNDQCNMGVQKCFVEGVSNHRRRDKEEQGHGNSTSSAVLEEDVRMKPGHDPSPAGARDLGGSPCGYMNDHLNNYHPPYPSVD
jgi:hypothetical protein